MMKNRFQALTIGALKLSALMVTVLCSGIALCGQMATSPQPEPELLAPGVISTPDDEVAATVSPDGRVLFFSRSGAICESRWREGRWSTPEVAAFSGQYGDYYPSLSPDGARLYFTSSRPVAPGQSPSNNFDIWVVNRTADGWSEPENLGPPINTNEGEVYCSTTRDGSIFFGSGRNGDRHILVSRLVDGKYTTPESLGEGINTRYFQGYHAVPTDGRFIIFTSNRPGGLGGFDLYISYRTNSGWTEPENLGPGINSAADETHASISPDDKYLFFASNRTCLDRPLEERLSYQELLDKLRGTLGGNRNIYRVDISKKEPR